MKYITVKLTEDQAKYVADSLSSHVVNWDYPKSDKYNAFTFRIINKIRKQLQS